MNRIYSQENQYRVRGGYVVGVTGRPVARELAVDLGSSCERVLLCFEQKNARSLGHDKSSAVFVEGPRCSLRSVVELSHHRSELAEAGEAQRSKCRLRAPREHYVGLAVAHVLKCRANGMCSGCTSSGDAVVRTFSAVLYRNHALITIMRKLMARKNSPRPCSR